MPSLGTTVGVLPMWQIWTILGLLAVARPARQGDLPGRPRRGVRVLHRGLPVRRLRGRHDHRRQARVRGDLDGGCHLEAQQALPVRDLDDDVEQSVDQNEVAQAQVLREVPRRSASRARCRDFIAHFSTAIEMLVPLALLFSHGGWPTAIAAFVMVCFHFGILSAIPMGVPLEWNVFMIFSRDHAVRRPRRRRPVRHDHAAARAALRAAGHHRGARQPVPAQDLVPARHAVLRRQLGHHVVVHQAVGQREDRPRTRGDRQHAGLSAREVLRQPGTGDDLPVQGICVPRLQLSRQGVADPGAQRVGRTQRGRLRDHRGRAALQHRRRAGTSATVTCTTSS